MWRFVLAGMVCALLCSPPVRAQLPRRLERCLPYPTYQQEIKAMDEEMAARPGMKESSQRIIVDDVKFDGPIHLSDALRQQVVSDLKQRDFNDNSGSESAWLAEIQAVGLIGVWQDQGYFKVEATAKEEFIRNDFAGKHVRIIAHINEGQQFRLGDVQFRSSDPAEPLAFGPEELRRLIPMGEGDIFSAAKIREGLDALRDLYGSHGYIDFVATPLTDIDDSRQRISLLMELDQQKQFRVASVEVYGLDQKMETLLKSKLKPGDVYNWQVVEDFLKQNASALPSDISPSDIELHRNIKRGTIDLRFNIFHGCPSLPE
jgi:surface antigen-like variable number repeat protein